MNYGETEVSSMEITLEVKRKFLREKSIVLSNLKISRVRMERLNETRVGV